VQVACWGLTKSQEMTIVRGMARQCNVQGLSDSEVRCRLSCVGFALVGVCESMLLDTLCDGAAVLCAGAA